MQDAAPKAPLRVSVGELSWSHAKHGSMTEGAGCRNRLRYAPRRIRTTFPLPLSLRGRRPWQSVLFPVPWGDRAMLRIAGVTDCHVASLLAMTRKIEPGASAYGAVRPPREGWPYIFARRERRPRRSAEHTKSTAAPRRIRTTFPLPMSLRGRRPWQSPARLCKS